MRYYIVQVVENVAEARETLRRNPPRSPMLFMDYDGRPIAAWADDGRADGILYTRADVRKRRAPSHRYGGSASAYDALARSMEVS